MKNNGFEDKRALNIFDCRVMTILARDSGSAILILGIRALILKY